MNILFVSETLPQNTFASSVVFYRHLQKLAKEGHVIHVLTDSNSYEKRSAELPGEFHVHLLPNRKWYYPPYKTKGIFQEARFQDYYHFHVKDLLKRLQIDCLLGFVSGQFLAPFAAFLKERTGLLLISFFHDDTLELNFYRPSKTMHDNTARLLKASDTVLIASDAFRGNWPLYEEKFELLYPIPAEKVEPVLKPTRSDRLSFGYSGSVYNEMILSLEWVCTFLQGEQFEFTIIGNNKKISYLADRFANVRCEPMFDTPELANAYLQAHCDLCVIPYPATTAEMPWIKTCFPSKLIQYCQLSIPTLVIAPADSALGQWCRENNWLLYADSYETETLSQLLETYLGSDTLLQQISWFRDTIFNPESIHSQFAELLNGRTRLSPAAA